MIQTLSCERYCRQSRTFISHKYARIVSGKPSPDGATIGTLITLGGKEMEVDRSVSRDEFYSGRIFGTGAQMPIATIVSSSSISRKFVSLKPAQLNPVRTSNGNSANPNSTKSVELQPVNLLQKGSVEPLQSTLPVTHWSGNW